MPKGKKLSEIEKFQRACNAIDFSQVNERELDDVYVGCVQKAKEAKKKAIEKQIEQLQETLKTLQ